MSRLLIFLLFCLFFSCQSNEIRQNNVVTSDIDNFWIAYDEVIAEPDSIKQLALFDSLYIQKGTLGLEKIMEARNYTKQRYVDLINRYPKYWNSIRANTFKSKQMAEELNAGIQKLKAIYPSLKPAKIYFTIGAMRTNGTTRDSMVLIGSELAMADPSTDISEFEGRTKNWLEHFFGTNPLKGLVLLNVHEYVHTQQNPIPNNLLHMVLYEGVAEFVSVIAMDEPSATPAIEFGKNNLAVRDKFQREMFWERTYDWLWSNTPNEFEVRDLGYYIGYAIAELHYNQSTDKQQAIQELIELDYQSPEKINALIDQTAFFTKPLDSLRKEDRAFRPSVRGISEFGNGSKDVDSNVKQITIEFSDKLNGYNTGVDYSELGEAAFPKITNRSWAPDSMSWTMEVELIPNKQYKFWIGENFRSEKNIPLLPYLIEFRTSGLNLK